jgi:hypothetical protein
LAAGPVGCDGGDEAGGELVEGVFDAGFAALREADEGGDLA